MDRSKIGELDLELGRALAIQVAPEEAPFFDQILISGESDNITDHPLAFGVPETIEFSTFAVIAVAQFIAASIGDTLKAAAADLLKGATEELKIHADRKIRTIIANIFSEKENTGISESQKQEIITSALDIGRRGGLTNDQTIILQSILENAL